MKQSRWVEIIGVRLFSPKNRSVVEKIFESLNTGQHKTPDKETSAELYHNNMVDSDWSIYLYRDPTGLSPEKTRLGLGIADAFNSLGLVNHSVWTMKLTKRDASI